MAAWGGPRGNFNNIAGVTVGSDGIVYVAGPSEKRIHEFDRRGRVFIFRCTHFDWATRSCDSYGSRPGMCRDYPRVLLQQANPEFLPGCGYRPVAPNAERLVRSLERASVTREQRERLRKDLHLEK